jgi:nitrogen permease regulator 3-like protein
LTRPPVDKVGFGPFIPPFVSFEPLVILKDDPFNTHTFMTPPRGLGRKSTNMSTKSSLLGVALIIRSKDGPRFVFNYPPHLANKECQERSRYGTELDPTTPDTSDDEGRSDDDDLEDDRFQINNRLLKKARHVSSWDGDEHLESIDGVQIVPWEYLDAFRIQDLASILTPARLYHKKCFELTLDPLHFVTYPMHIREDGQWKKKKKPKKTKSRKQAASSAESGAVNGNVEAESPREQPEDVENGPEAENINDKTTEGGKEGSENGNDEGGMTMFNMVFILNPGRLEATAEVANILEHVAKDINKALRYAQSYSNYVWKESDFILNMKDKAKEKSVYILTFGFL